MTKHLDRVQILRMLIFIAQYIKSA